MAKSKVKSKEEVVETKTESNESSLYFFYTQGCGWCKKVIPLIDELNESGHEILKLDLADGDNRKLQDEIKKEYKHQCGTPYFVDAETGNTICGYREKDVLEKWAKGEEIPQPVRPTGPPPKPPLMGASKEEEEKWTKEYDEWYKKNDKLPNVKTAEQLLKMPRPKSDPPKPPAPDADDKALETWSKGYKKWSKENDHLPNMIPAETIVERFKQRRNAQANQPPAPQGVAKLNPEQEARLQRVEQKLDKLMKHLGVK
tara:strand:+ start:155 stop:925 length:771 start_codon:yes stop_codon:yes gene_type:complete